MTLDGAIRTIKYDFEGGLGQDNRTTREQHEWDTAWAVVNQAMAEGTYNEARSRVALEDNWALHFPEESR